MIPRGWLSFTLTQISQAEADEWVVEKKINGFHLRFIVSFALLCLKGIPFGKERFRTWNIPMLSYLDGASLPSILHFWVYKKSRILAKRLLFTPGSTKKSQTWILHYISSCYFVHPEWQELGALISWRLSSLPGKREGRKELLSLPTVPPSPSWIGAEAMLLNSSLQRREEKELGSFLFSAA